MKGLTNLTITDLWEEYKRSFRDYWEGHDEVVKAFRKKLIEKALEEVYNLKGWPIRDKYAEDKGWRASK